MSSPDDNAARVTYSENITGVEGFEATAEDVIEAYGGSIVSRASQRIRFALPRRQGDDSAGALDCDLEWTSDEPVRVTLSSSGEIEGPRTARLALLIVGSAGALAFIFWPFFPAMGPLSGIGLVVAIAVYMMTLRRSPHGIVGGLLQQIVDAHEASRVEAAE